MIKKHWHSRLSKSWLFLLFLVLLLTTFVLAQETTADSSGISDIRSGGEDFQPKDCSNTSTGLQPLVDLNRGGYEGYSGNLYNRGDNPPTTHLQQGLETSQEIQPLDNQGNPSSSGKIVLLSVGMSNTHQEFERFMRTVRGQVNQNLVLVNGAQATYDAARIVDPTTDYWDNIDEQLADRHLSPAQVQVIWLKEAVSNESNQFPQDALDLESYLRQIVLIIENRFPNIQAVYFSSRTYGGYALPNSASPEPWAYESAFAVKWLINEQIYGTDPDLAYSNTPWLAWGPYLWADGMNPRSDGLTWECDDFESDGIHPSASGELKTANLLLDFFNSDPTTTWFSSN